MERTHTSSAFPDEYLAEVAAKYDTLKEFQEKEMSVYSIIRRRGLADKLCSHMKTERRFLTDEQLSEIAKGCKTRKEFMEKDSAAYTTACARGIIDKICSHMERLGNWAKRKVYVFTFSDGYAYIGLTQDTKRRYRQHVKGERYSAVHDHIKETGATFDFKILTDWLSPDEAGRVEDDNINKYAAAGWKMLNKIGGGAIGSPRGGYTRMILERETKKYEYIEDFKEGSPRFYKYIIRNHLYDEFCGHMKSRNE
jgi:hypothetical protein